MNEAKMKQQLAEANAHIADTERRIARLGEIIAECSPGGQSADEAKKHLAVLTEELKTMQQRRELILSKLTHKQV